MATPNAPSTPLKGPKPCLAPPEGLDSATLYAISIFIIRDQTLNHDQTWLARSYCLMNAPADQHLPLSGLDITCGTCRDTCCRAAGTPFLRGLRAPQPPDPLPSPDRGHRAGIPGAQEALPVATPGTDYPHQGKTGRGALFELPTPTARCGNDATLNLPREKMPGWYQVRISSPPAT